MSTARKKRGTRGCSVGGGTTLGYTWGRVTAHAPKYDDKYKTCEQAKLPVQLGWIEMTRKTVYVHLPRRHALRCDQQCMLAVYQNLRASMTDFRRNSKHLIVPMPGKKYYKISQLSWRPVGTRLQKLVRMYRGGWIYLKDLVLASLGLLYKGAALGLLAVAAAASVVAASDRGVQYTLKKGKRVTTLTSSTERRVVQSLTRPIRTMTSRIRRVGAKRETVAQAIGRQYSELRTQYDRRVAAIVKHVPAPGDGHALQEVETEHKGQLHARLRTLQDAVAREDTDATYASLESIHQHWGASVNPRSAAPSHPHADLLRAIASFVRFYDRLRQSAAVLCPAKIVTEFDAEDAHTRPGWHCVVKAMDDAGDMSQVHLQYIPHGSAYKRELVRAMVGTRREHAWTWRVDASHRAGMEMKMPGMEMEMEMKMKMPGMKMPGMKMSGMEMEMEMKTSKTKTSKTKTSTKGSRWGKARRK